MQQLAAAGKWEPGRPVGCVLISNGAPADTAESFETARRNLELSLAENTGREELHPVDQAEAFRVLRDEQGATDRQLAARFGVSGRTVQRRLRMAQASPELRRKCRDGELSLGVLEAVCIEPDHERQAEAVAAAGDRHNAPAAVMSYLKKEAVPADSWLGRFVGLDRYQAAGGLVSQDLSADGGRGAHYMDDKAKVQRLMMERLREEARKERDVNGWPAKQVECAVESPWNYYSHWDRADATKLSDLPEPARAGAVLHLGVSPNADVEQLVLVKKGTLAPGRPSSPIGEDGDSPADQASLPWPLVQELRAMRLSVLREAFLELSDTGGELARDLRPAERVKLGGAGLPPLAPAAMEAQQHRGSCERRSIAVFSPHRKLFKFPCVQQAYRITHEQCQRPGRPIQRSYSYGISSLPAAQASPRCLLQLQRGHWQVESANHYRRDLSFGEDASRVRTGHGPANTAALNNAALAVLLLQGKFATVPEAQIHYAANSAAAVRLLTRAA